MGQLSLSRSVGQTIVIDGPAIIQIKGVRGNPGPRGRCRDDCEILITAPATTSIVRGELIDERTGDYPKLET